MLTIADVFCCPTPIDFSGFVQSLCVKEVLRGRECLCVGVLLIRKQPLVSSWDEKWFSSKEGETSEVKTEDQEICWLSMIAVTLPSCKIVSQ